jgi:hypothetical protein
MTIFENWISTMHSALWDDEFEQDVTSDMHGNGNDIVNSLRQEFNTFGIDQQISWSKVEEK